jgi:hypothetical protein
MLKQKNWNPLNERVDTNQKSYELCVRTIQLGLLAAVLLITVVTSRPHTLISLSSIRTNSAE